MKIDFNHVISKSSLKFVYAYRNVLFVFSLFMLIATVLVPLNELEFSLFPFIISIGGFMAAFKLSIVLKKKDQITIFQMVKNILLVCRMTFLALIYISVITHKMIYLIAFLSFLILNIVAEIFLNQYEEKK